jgi:hypothetical protein
VIADNWALSAVIFGGSKIMTPAPVTLQLGMAEADLSNTNLGAGGAIIISAWSTHRDKEALTEFDISNNQLCAEGTKFLTGALKDNQVTTELNVYSSFMGNMGRGAGGGFSDPDMSGVIALGNFIPGMWGADQARHQQQCHPNMLAPAPLHCRRYQARAYQPSPDASAGSASLLKLRSTESGTIRRRFQPRSR